jgi:Ca2+-binding RTX toxin-like protein
MQININYDSSVASAPSGFTAAFEAAVQYFENLIQNPVTVNINVGWGEVQGIALAANARAENIENWPSGYSYAQVAAALNASGVPGAGGLPATDPTRGGQFTMTSAQAKALNLMSANDPTTDGWIGFSSTASYDFNTSLNSWPKAGPYDFFGIAVHEISQVLGRQMTDGLGGQYTPLDLFHYSAPGVRDLNAAAGYFSTDSGVTDLNDFNANTGWGDPGDWVNAHADVFDTTTYPGEPMPVTSSDITVMQALGWQLSTNQQATATISTYTLNGSVLFNGTAGNVSIVGGGSGDETIWSGSYDTITGGAANMTVGGAQYDTITGGTGYDFLDGSRGNESISGGAGGVKLIWSGAGDTINGGGGQETIGGVQNDTIIGGTGSEFIDGSAGQQVIVGGTAGQETIWGGVGDTVYGGGDAAVTIGGGQYDTIIGGTGTERIDGWLGHQLIIGGTTGDEMLIGARTDTIQGGSGGNEFIDVTAGYQQITGGTGGNETIWGGPGDTINGGGGANVTIGGVAFDTITGGSGTEFIDGSLGNQLITAGSGNETIWGGAGDTITAGAGKALIGLGAGPEFIGAPTVGGGADTVTGFNLGAGDRILVPNATTATVNALLASATTANGSTTLTFGNGSTLTLAGIAHIDNSIFG